MKKVSAETREKMRISALKRDNTKRIASMPKGENHWSWNKKPSKLTLHKRLHRKYGPANQFPCADCGEKAKDYSNESGNYTDDINDYKPRCRACHVKKDMNWIKKK